MIHYNKIIIVIIIITIIIIYILNKYRFSSHLNGGLMFFAFFLFVTVLVSASCEAQVAHFEIDAFLQFQRSDEALPARHFHLLRHDEVTRSDGL